MSRNVDYLPINTA